MGRINVETTIENGTDATFSIRCDALVDTGAAYLTLPNAWRDRLGGLTRLDTVDVQVANQAVIRGEICGPVLLRMERFRPVQTEVLFTDMDPTDGRYEPLIGYIPLEQAQAVVDLVGHRLVKVSLGRSQVTRPHRPRSRRSRNSPRAKTKPNDHGSPADRPRVSRSSCVLPWETRAATSA